MSQTLQLAKQLIGIESVTPNDNGCQKIIGNYLADLGFKIESLPFGKVQNLWARYGDEEPLFCFAGHTDVVPAGRIEDWKYDPFTPTIDAGNLYGRGSADMKSSIAAMLVACQQFMRQHNMFAQGKLQGSLAFLITSDEEGAAIDGTRRVIEHLTQRGEKIKYCLVGEPSSSQRVGDVIKNGRRGSLNCDLTIIGKQGHIAYPQLAKNPIHLALPALQELATTTWDKGNQFFMPTSLQISNLNAGTGVGNVIPGVCELSFNFRFATASSSAELIKRSEDILRRHGLEFRANWNLSGEAFLTPAGKLLSASKKAVNSVCNITPELSTAGGTSDGRFIAPTGAEVLELGPCNATIHQVNEHTNIAQLEQLTAIYQQLLNNLFDEKIPS